MAPSTSSDRSDRARRGSGIATRAMVIAVVTLAGAAIAVTWPGSVGAPFWFWLIACAVGEAMWLRLPAGNATLSMGSCFNLAALLVLPLGEALLATAVASFTVEMFVMRKPVVRGLYNAAHTVLGVGAGSFVFGAVAGRSTDLVTLISEVHLAPLVLAALAYYAVNRAAVAGIVALHDRTTVADVWRTNFGSAYEYLSTGAVFSLGMLLAIHYAAVGMAGTLLVVLPLALVFDGYRRRADVARRAEEALPAEDRRAA